MFTRKPKLKDLIFKEFLPSDFEERLTVIKAISKMLTLSIALPSIFWRRKYPCIFYWWHAKGQACLFISDYDLFIAADLCWGIDLLPYTKQMHLIPSLVQDSKDDYIKGTELLEEVLKDGIEVLVSHDPVERIERILYEKNNLS